MGYQGACGNTEWQKQLVSNSVALENGCRFLKVWKGKVSAIQNCLPQMIN